MPGATLSTAAAAARCGVDRRTILRWVKAGLLPSFQTGGGHHRIREEDLLAFLRDRGTEPPGPPRRRVVVVDDDEHHLRAVERVLRRTRPDLEVALAADGFTGGLTVARLRPDLLLLDIVMPGLDGFAVCERLRAWPALRDTVVVVVSGHLDASARARFEALGVARCLAKPLSPEALAGVLDAYVPAAAARPRVA